MFVRAYLRASTAEQNAERAKQSLIDFATAHHLVIAKFYIENESGAKLERPKLNELLNDCQVGDILLIEDIDRLSRLNGADWETLRERIKAKRIRIVALNVPTTHTQAVQGQDEITERILSAVNDMLIEILASVARRDYEQRRQRQAQGIERAKQNGIYKGKQPNIKQYKAILAMVDTGATYAEIIDILKVGTATIVKAKKWRKQQITETESKITFFEPSHFEPTQQTKKRRGRKSEI